MKYDCQNCGYSMKNRSDKKGDLICRRNPIGIVKENHQWCGRHKTRGEIKLEKEISIARVTSKYN